MIFPNGFNKGPYILIFFQRVLGAKPEYDPFALLAQHFVVVPVLLPVQLLWPKVPCIRTANYGSWYLKLQ